MTSWEYLDVSLRVTDKSLGDVVRNNRGWIEEFGEQRTPDIDSLHYSIVKEFELYFYNLLEDGATSVVWLTEDHRLEIAQALAKSQADSRATLEVHRFDYTGYGPITYNMGDYYPIASPSAEELLGFGRDVRMFFLDPMHFLKLAGAAGWELIASDPTPSHDARFISMQMKREIRNPNSHTEQCE